MKVVMYDLVKNIGFFFHSEEMNFIRLEDKLVDILTESNWQSNYI